MVVSYLSENCKLQLNGSIDSSVGGGGCAKKPLSMASITCPNATEIDRKA